MTPTVINALAVLIGTIIGSGGITALITAISKSKKDKNDFEKERSGMITELQKYMNEEMKSMVDKLKGELTEIKEENIELKKEIKDLNKQLAELVQWVMSDNAAYRTWLENTLKEFDPDIVMPKCSDPPIVFNVNEDDAEDLDEDIND